MGKLIVSEFVTLDGVIEDPGGAEKFKYGGWTWPYQTEEIGKFKYTELFKCDALLLGRVTYQGFAAAWPSRTEDDFSKRMNSIPKYVATKTLDKVEWNNSHILEGDVPTEVAKLKTKMKKDILIAGSGELVRTLMEHGLIDEYRFLVFPLVLGEGKRLFKEGTPASLKLTRTESYATGVVLLCYEPKKKVKPK